MKKFNLSTRIVLFTICTSIEFDIKKYILKNCSEITFTEDMILKGKKRNKKLEISDAEEVLNQLDLGDYVELIASNPYSYGINNDNAKAVRNYFEKIIPVRNRVMHTKPLEVGDRAVLTEVMEDLDGVFTFINWQETIRTREIIKHDPSKLISYSYEKVIEYNPKVYHNLPEPEFDDTGYIGRNKEIKEIKELLVNKKNQIVTIIGNGGIGKTAIAVKTLYELTEDEESPFEAILWLSLKTRALSKGEFILINNSIKEVSELYENSGKFVITDEKENSKENLIYFMQAFKTLLVLDNLETINNEDINSFLKEIPEESKVLITSRHGIGELEYRYKLEGMSLKDGITYFRELSKYYGLELYKKENKDIQSIIEDSLYSNPLSIKWFLSGIYYGMDENSILSKKEELVEFCMSNVYEKLSSEAKEVLQLFLIENKDLSLGEIDFFIEVEDITLRKIVNELLTTNMLSIRSSRYYLNQMARDYISLYHSPSNDFFLKIIEKRKKLNIILQEIQVRNENDPFNPKSLFANSSNDNRKLASYYLDKALACSSINNWGESFECTEKAANIAPDYFEVFKIKAFLLSENRDFYGALQNYQIALAKCETNFEKATVLYLFSVFYTIKLTDNQKALELIDEALEYCPEEFILQIEKARVLTYNGKFSDAEDILHQLKEKSSSFGARMQNIYASRYGELHRRIAERIDKRDIEIKFNRLKEGIEVIEKISKIDQKTYVVLISILLELSYLYFYEPALELLSKTLKTHSNQLKSNKSKKLEYLRKNIYGRVNEIPETIYKSIITDIYDFKEAAVKIKNNKQGIIVFIKDHYGFISNSLNKSIYFKVKNLPDNTIVGDIVEFEMYKDKGGSAAKNIKKLYNLFEKTDFYSLN